MATFEELRAAFSRADAHADLAGRQARTAALRARRSNGDDHADADAKAARERADGASRLRGDALAAFEPFSDPRRGLAHLDDSTPVLLMPVRLETRYRTTPGGAAGGERHELLVRVYPDECSVDAFDPELSEAELDAVSRFWREYWRAGGVDADARAAWKSLAGSYGSGRASWLLQAFAPVNASERPTRNPSTDLVLVVAGTGLPIGSTRTALTAYWEATWRAAGNPTLQTTARAALVAALGSVGAADAAVAAASPFNLGDGVPAGLTRSTTTIIVAWQELPDVQPEVRHGWRRAPTAAALPERFVVVGFSGGDAPVEALGHPVAEPLYVGPDPSAPDAERIVPGADGTLSIPEPLAWMFDFAAAEAAGMGIRLPLTAAQAARGFDRLAVLGVRLRAGADEGRATFESLIAGHRYSRAGFELLTQGSPTNNADDVPSAWSRRDDPDLAYDDVFGPEKFTVKADPLEQRDGQRFADRLGLDPAGFLRARGADGRDGIEAQAMNMALAPGTLGYMAGTLMQPVFDGWVDELTWFFAAYVSGRGAIPAVRIGAQPYGIVASTAFSRLSWLQSTRGTALRDRLRRTDRQWTFLQRLHQVLGALEANWRELASTVAHVGDGKDPHATLLAVLGLHPGSVEFHSRTGKSLDELVSRARLARVNGMSARLRAQQQRTRAQQLLRALGYNGADPQILDLFFRSGQMTLKGPLIEGLPVSETVSLADSTVDGRNYLEWLATTAKASLDLLRRQEGFAADAPPQALLYLMMQFALTRGYLDAGDRLRVESGLFAVAQMAALRREPAAVHLDPSVLRSESPWVRLYEADARLTGRADVSIADHVTSVLGTRPTYAVDLADQIRAIETLESTPTARLERTFVEHIDTVSYRFDAWRVGLVHWQLERMRGTGANGEQARGLYLGAYGWLENVRPKARALPVPPLSAALAETFKAGPPLQVDPSNGGHLHAPSLNQAVTAAMLRAGDLATRGTGADNPFAINLSSERVRKAVGLLEGIRAGQQLGALLGYRFERALHDAGGTFELDALIFAFRRAFPLTADKLTPTRGTGLATEAIEARNVVDGLALMTQASSAGHATYPFGRTLPALDPPARAVVEAAVNGLKDIFDAMADLLLAEGVHQAAQGNPDRVAAHLNVQGDFNAPPDPAVVALPTRGFALTCRAGIELNASAVAAPSAPPRAKAQPALNEWLATALPPLSLIGCTATWSVAGVAQPPLVVTLADLGVSPIDVIYLVADDGGEGFGELDDRVRRRVNAVATPRSDARITIEYMTAGAGQMTVFVASALVKRLGGLALRSRPLRASDVSLPGSAAASDAVPHVVERGRLADVVADLSTLRAALDGALAAGDALLADPVTNRATLVAGIDGRIGVTVERLAEAARFGGARIGWGSVYDWRSERVATLIGRFVERLSAWAGRLAACDAALADDLTLPVAATPDEHMLLLRAAEGQVSTALASDTTPIALRGTVATKRAAFVSRRDAIAATVIDALDAGLADRLAKATAVLSLEAFDPTPFSIADIEDSVVAYWHDLQGLLGSARKDIDARITRALAALSDHDAAADAPARLKALQAGAEAMFGEGFALIPTFVVPADAGTEQSAALAHFTSGQLLAHARTAGGDDHPLDTWLYGTARVRPKMRLLEDAIMLWEAHGLTPGSLTAIQLPHKPGAPWMALDFPKADAPDGERLAYVAVVRPGYAPAGARCGLLLDDWNETIPAVEPDEPGPQHTTGVAFHFDRPSQEPPQAMLLLTPAQWSGAWSWDDLLHGVVDTFELARMRAVEPDQLDSSGLAQFLPATVASVTTSGLMLSANYALMNMAPRVARSTADG